MATSEPIVTRMAQTLIGESRWRVFQAGAPDEVLARVTFVQGTVGDTGCVVVNDASPEVRDFLIYYLEDPLNGHPAHLHGRGQRSGPHSNDLDQFDWVMAALGHHFPTVAAEPIW